MLAALCATTGALPARGGIALGLLLAGAAGSTMHCVPMCGGFVLGQVADRLARVPAPQLCEWRRLSAGALLPYHVGRLTTYAGLGALAGFGGGAISRLPWFGWLSGSLLLLAALLFALHALRRLVPRLAARLPAFERAPSGLQRGLARLTGRIDRNSLGGSLALGAALGFLPCGLLYAALTTASATFSPLAGAVAMLAFGLGTAPALIAVGIAGQAAGRRWQRAITGAAPMVMLANAALLTVVAMQHFLFVS